MCKLLKVSRATLYYVSKHGMNCSKKYLRAVEITMGLEKSW